LKGGGLQESTVRLFYYVTQSNDDCGVRIMRKEEKLKYHA
jgi:hypothetical protein